jgi:hypothetical protein
MYRMTSISTLGATLVCCLSAPAAWADPGATGGGSATASTSPIELVEVIESTRVGRHEQITQRPLALVNGERLEGRAFYLALGRPDLAETYARRARLRTGVALAGVAAALGGMAAIFLHRPHAVCADLAATPTFPLPSTQCHTDWETGWITGGLAVTGAGMVALGVAGWALDPDPFTAGELRRAVRDHNARLDEGVEGPGRAPPWRPAGTTLLPSVVDGTAGLALGGSF